MIRSMRKLFHECGSKRIFEKQQCCKRQAAADPDGEKQTHGKKDAFPLCRTRFLFETCEIEDNA